MTIHVSEQWGPFAPNLDPVERVGRLRTLRAIAHLVLSPRGHPLTDELQRAERNDVALEYALAGLNALASKDRRQVWASYAALTIEIRPDAQHLRQRAAIEALRGLAEGAKAVLLGRAEASVDRP